MQTEPKPTPEEIAEARAQVVSAGQNLLDFLAIVTGFFLICLSLNGRNLYLVVLGALLLFFAKQPWH